jgi:hypothetical protein
MLADLIFFTALWVCGFLLGWAAHERDWRKAYIAENKRLMTLLGQANEAGRSALASEEDGR